MQQARDTYGHASTVFFIQCFAVHVLHYAFHTICTLSEWAKFSFLLQLWPESRMGEYMD